MHNHRTNDLGISKLGLFLNMMYGHDYEQIPAFHTVKKMFYLMMHSTHFIYGFMVSDIW